MKILFLFLIYCTVNSFPIKETLDEPEAPIRNKNESGNDPDIRSSNITENNLNIESRAGIIDQINPFNKAQRPPQTNTDNRGTVNSFPIKETLDEPEAPIRNKNESGNDPDIRSSNITENNLNIESRAGIIDQINPFNKEQRPPQTNTDNRADGQNNNPLAALQNLFSNAPQLFNGSNPFAQLFSTQPGGNFLDNIKVFLVGTQGMVMPASAIFGGFQNLMQSFGNVGNLVQNLPTPLPLGRK